MQLTDDQKAKLALITNPQQREMLLEAIREGYEPPEVAWEPLPADLDMVEMFGQMDELLDDVADEIGASKDDFESSCVQEFHLEQLGLCARKTATKKSEFLCDPITLNEPIEPQGGSVKLVCWGYFNPMGPTACELSLEPVESLDAALLVLHSFHPFAPWAGVYGLVPNDFFSNRDLILRSLSTLFGNRGSDELSLVAGPPSHVVVPEESPLSQAEVSRMFAAALSDTSAEDLRQACELMRRYWCKPWDRASEEQQLAFSDALASRPQESSSEEAAPEQESSSSSALFSDWWNLVTDRDHVAAEIREMSAAWEGAIAFRRGDFRSQ